MKTTRAQVENCFRRFIEELNGGKIGFKPGQYSLDYVSQYGGFVIELNGEYGVSHPFGSARHSQSELWEMMSFSLEVMRQIRRTK